MPQKLIIKHSSTTNATPEANYLLLGNNVSRVLEGQIGVKPAVTRQPYSA